MRGNALKLFGALALALTFAMVSMAAAAEGDGAKPEAKSQTTCPVMGGKIDKSIFVDHDGKRVYLCCKGCIAEFAKDPAKYVKKLEDAGVTLEKAPAKDPAAKSGTTDGAKCTDGKCGDGPAKSGGCCGK